MEQTQMTVKEAAAHLGLTTRTVRTWIESGRLRGERVEGRFGPEWRLDPDEVRSAAKRRTDEPVALDLAGRPGGNDIRALVAVITSELRAIQERQSEHTQYILQMSDAMARLSQTLPAPSDESPVEGLIRQSARVQQTVEEDSRARRREAQEFQAALQSLGAALQDQSEQVAHLTEELSSLGARPLPWYRRLFRSI